MSKKRKCFYATLGGSGEVIADGGFTRLGHSDTVHVSIAEGHRGARLIVRRSEVVMKHSLEQH